MERLTGIKPTLTVVVKLKAKLSEFFSVVEQSSIFRGL